VADSATRPGTARSVALPAPEPVLPRLLREGLPAVAHGRRDEARAAGRRPASSLWFGKGQLGAAGLAVAAVVHDLSMTGLSVLMIGHVDFTILYGALPAMETGRVSADYARLEHRAWYDEVTGARRGDRR
jgi:hypothetical protein